jgi:hypothetical protein
MGTRFSEVGLCVYVSVCHSFIHSFIERKKEVAEKKKKKKKKLTS